MITIDLKPLSVNCAFQGKRFKTDKYNKYEIDCLFLLPPLVLPTPPFRVKIEFGFSNKASDIDNPIKMTLDILQKKYKFDDKEVYELNVKKTIVKKGKEYTKIEIESVNKVLINDYFDDIN